MASIDLDDTYTDAFKEWNDEIRADVAMVLSCVQNNPLFEPDPNFFLHVHDSRARICTCQKISGWEGWQLVWYYEVDTRFLLDSVTSVLVMAYRNPPQRIKAH